MSAEQPNKRRRASELGLLQPSPSAAWQAEFGSQQDLFLDDEEQDKPDVFEYLSQRSQRQRELENTVRQLQASSSELSSQLQEAQRQISALKAENTGLTARYGAREAQLDLRVQEQELALRKEIERGARLQTQLRQAQEAKSAAELRAEQVAAAAAQSGTSAADKSQREQELRLQVTELEHALSQAITEREESQTHLQQQLQTEQQRCRIEVESNRLLQQQLEDAVAAAEAISRQKHSLESNAAELERLVVNLESQLAQAKSREGDAVVVRNLREQLRAQEQLVAEARKLKEQATNVHVLREQLAAVEARAKRSEHFLDEQTELYSRVAELEQQLQHWTLILEGTAECTTPEEVLRFIQRLQAEQVAAAARLTERADELATLKASVSAAEEDKARAEARQQEAAARANEVEASLARAERKAALLTKEREGLKAILASYDEEYLNHQGGQILPQQTRIAELEGTVEGLHAHIQSLEEELRAYSAQPEQDGTTTSALREALERADSAEASVKRLEQQAENLMQQVALLEARLGRGDYNTATTRVLHFKYNPEAELAREARDARVAQLETENVALKEHLQRLELAQQGQDQTEGGGTMRVAQLEGENRLLKSRVAQAQKSADRLQQVFNKQITVFREAVYTLFGYRVEMSTDPGAREFKAQFALRPQQSEGANDELVFRLHKDGRMVLVPNSFTTNKLQREVDTFIERFKSIPAFTANLTMEWFQRHTQG